MPQHLKPLTTGSTIANAATSMLREWSVDPGNISALVFDTTSANTDLRTGA